MVQFPRKIIHYQKTALLTVFHVFYEGNEKLKTGKRSRVSFQFELLIIKGAVRTFFEDVGFCHVLYFGQKTIIKIKKWNGIVALTETGLNR